MKALFVAMLAGVGLASPAHASVVFFDGFESPSQSGGYSYGGTDAAGASFGDGTGLQANGSAFGYAAAPEGVQTAHIQGEGAITETLPILAVGQTYSLTFFVANRPGYATDPITVSYDPTLTPDPLLLTYGPTSDSWTQVTASFVATSPTGALVLAGTVPQVGGDFNVGIDGVMVSSIPEESTWAMMLMGFAGLGFLAYSQSRKDSIKMTLA